MPRAPCVTDRFPYVDAVPEPNRFQFPVPADRTELTLPDLAIVFREAIDAAPYREASRLFGYETPKRWLASCCHAALPANPPAYNPPRKP